MEKVANFLTAIIFAALVSLPVRRNSRQRFRQLVTPVAYYLREDEVRPWLASARFRDAALARIGGYSWTGLGAVCRTKAAVRIACEY